MDQSPPWKYCRIGRHAIRRFTGADQTDGDITHDRLNRLKSQDAATVLPTDVVDQKTPDCIAA